MRHLLKHKINDRVAWLQAQIATLEGFLKRGKRSDPIGHLQFTNRKKYLELELVREKLLASGNFWSFASDLKHCRGSWFIDYMPGKDPSALTRSYRYFDFKMES